MAANRGQAEKRIAIAFSWRDADVLELACKAAVLPAIYDGLGLCREPRRPLPSWLKCGLDWYIGPTPVTDAYPPTVNDEVDKLVCLVRISLAQKQVLAEWKNPRQRRPGRGGTLKSRYENDQVHLARWKAVTFAREAQVALRDSRRSAQTTEGGSARRVKIARGVTTWPIAYEMACDLLLQTPAYGSPNSMKRSYEIVESTLTSENYSAERGRFYEPTPRTIKVFGIKPIRLRASSLEIPG